MGLCEERCECWWWPDGKDGHRFTARNIRDVDTHIEKLYSDRLAALAKENAQKTARRETCILTICRIYGGWKYVLMNSCRRTDERELLDACLFFLCMVVKFGRWFRTQEMSAFCVCVGAHVCGMLGARSWACASSVYWTQIWSDANIVDWVLSIIVA